MVNNERQMAQDAEKAVRRVFDELGGFELRVRGEPWSSGEPCDLILEATSAEAQFELVVEVKARVTPQTAISVGERMRRLPPDVVPVISAPVISPRVAEIVTQFGVGYVDQAGNCRLRNARHRLLIDRRGYKSPVRPPKGVVDPFSPKSSRIVRAMLNEPARGWKVRELAVSPDIGVSVGLVAKVKQTLLEEGYAIEHKRLLYLRDPLGLLENWAKKYPGPAEQIPMYFRGNTEAAEQAVGKWCRDNGIRYALAGFSAAWRLAPEVRYNVGAVYVDSRAFNREILDKLNSYQGGKPVETGANLLLWRPFDQAVLPRSQSANQAEMPSTSPIQTFLDLKRLSGRGEEAATAIYERHLVRRFQEAAQNAEEMRHAEL